MLSPRAQRHADAPASRHRIDSQLLLSNLRHRLSPILNPLALRRVSKAVHQRTETSETEIVLAVEFDGVPVTEQSAPVFRPKRNPQSVQKLGWSAERARRPPPLQN